MKDEKSKQIKNLIKEFISILEIQEESDSGNAFYPNRISSCRVYDGDKMNKIILELKELTKELL